MNLNIPNEKIFSEFTKEEKNKLLAQNNHYLENELIDRKKIKKSIKKMLKEKGETLGLANLKMEEKENKTMVIQPVVFSIKFNDIIEKLKMHEEYIENEEIIKKAEDCYLTFKEIVGDYINIKIEICEGKISFRDTSNHYFILLDKIYEDIDYYLEKIKENTINTKKINAIQKIKMEHMYTDEIDKNSVAKLLFEFIQEKIDGMKPLGDFLNLKIEEIRKDIESESLLNNNTNLEDLLMKRTDILFDEKGFARKKRG